MSVGLSAPTALSPVPGVRLASAAAGIRYRDRKDLLLIELAEGSQVAAVFTQNAFCAAPVTLAKQHLQAVDTRYLLINSGNANAGTGEPGMQAAIASCEAVANTLGGDKASVLPFSTGVIGELLPVSPIANAMPSLQANLAEDAWLEAAHTIMTTDTVAKGMSKTLDMDGKTITITGISKGSGMICPNMATMLAYVATDAVIEQAELQRMLASMADASFNAITVDGDTSTNDACVLIATGQSGYQPTGENLHVFAQAVLELMQYLAQAIIRDGEGVTKFVSINVSAAVDVAEARQVAYTVAHSPLVKTALFASDPNWGRILAAVGRAGITDLEVNKVSLALNDVALLDAGQPAATYREELGAAEMQKDEIAINISLGRGEDAATIWTTDFSYEYVKINAEYRS